MIGAGELIGRSCVLRVLRLGVRARGANYTVRWNH